MQFLEKSTRMKYVFADYAPIANDTGISMEIILIAKGWKTSINLFQLVYID